MQLNGLRVLVAGGATSGASAALFLARAGAEVIVCERVAQPRAVGAGIAIAANGWSVLDALGLAGELASVAAQVDAPRVVDAEGRTLFAPPEPVPRVAMVRRTSLQGVFMDAMARESGVELRTGTEVVRARPDGAVDVRSAGGEQTLTADLVIGADGVHSAVRESASFDAEVSPPGIPYVRALAREGLARNEEAWTEAGLFGSFPVDGGTYLYASAGSPACRAAADARDLNAFREAWARAYAPSEELLRGLAHWDDLIVNRVIRVRCRRWHDGRIVLMGDAAHAMAPNLGQGANSALVDAAVLMDRLRHAPDLPSALAAYTQRRVPAVTRVADAAARLGALAERTHPAIRFVRDHLLMPTANRFANPRMNDLVLQERPEWLRTVR